MNNTEAPEINEQETAEQTFRRIASRKLLERGCLPQEVNASLERLMNKGCKLNLNINGLNSDLVQDNKTVET